jgi:hypothetical protein
LKFPESASGFNLELGFDFNSGLGFAISTLVWPLSLSSVPVLAAALASAVYVVIWV